MLYIDLNKFKQINDEFGHDEGDKALAVFANILKNTVRGSDLITRLGGDEFAILLTDATKRLAEEVVKKLLHAKKEYNTNANSGYNLYFSYWFNPYKTVPTLFARLIKLPFVSV